jgi:hypothetical protein
MIGLVAGAGGGITVYRYVTTMPPSWQSEIISHISINATDPTSTVSGMAFLYQGDYVWNQTTQTSSHSGKGGMWSGMIDFETPSAQLTITGLRIMTLDISENVYVSSGPPYYFVEIRFFGASGFTLKYDNAVVSTSTASEIQLEIDEKSFVLLLHQAY